MKELQELERAPKDILDKTVVTMRRTILVKFGRLKKAEDFMVIKGKPQLRVIN